MFLNLEKIRNILYSKKIVTKEHPGYNDSFDEIEKEAYNVEIYPEYNDSFLGSFILYESNFFSGIIKNGRTEEESYIFGKYDSKIEMTMIRGSYDGLWLYNMIGEYTSYNIKKTESLDFNLKEQIDSKRKYWQQHPIYYWVLKSISECNNKVKVKTKNS